MSEENEWGLVESFDIDGRELDDIPRHECFVMGVEFAMFRAMMLVNPIRFTSLCNTKNRDRLVSMCERHGRFVETHEIDTPGWAKLIVGGFKEAPR